jgi:uncharacterized protein
MKRHFALAGLAKHADAMRARGVAAAYLFGSTAREEAGESSDLDVFVDIIPGQKFSLIDLAGLHRYLEAELGVSIDLTTRSSLHPKLRSRIEHEAIQAF